MPAGKNRSNFSKYHTLLQLNHDPPEEEKELEEQIPDGLPMQLPFELTRPESDAPLSETEIATFTSNIAGFHKDIDDFTWVAETSHGNDASTGDPDFLIRWHDVDAAIPHNGANEGLKSNPTVGNSMAA